MQEPEQVLPQAPQFCAGFWLFEVRRSTQTPPQFTWPAAQQMPDWQGGGPEQTCPPPGPQPPQLLLLVWKSTHTPPQILELLQHAPPVQVWPKPQAWPQPPQLLLSLPSLTHEVPHW